MAGFHRKLCPNCSTITSSLANLLRKDVIFFGTESYQFAFDKVRAVLINHPVVTAPDFLKELRLAVDDSNVGVGALLLQEGKHDIYLPISFCSKSLTNIRKIIPQLKKNVLPYCYLFDIYVDLHFIN
jgi:hypothetical protein